MLSLKRWITQTCDLRENSEVKGVIGSVLTGGKLLSESLDLNFCKGSSRPSSSLSTGEIELASHCYLTTER